MEIGGPKHTYLSFLILMLLFFQICTKAQGPPHKEIPVGVILDMGSWVGKSILSCITKAVSDFYMVNSHYNTRIVLNNKDTHGKPLHGVSAAFDLLKKSKVQAIIGSESTTEAKFLAVLGDEARIPILSFSPTPSSSKHPYFLQITQDETTQFKGIVAMSESFGWKDVTIIFENTDNGRDMATLMTNLFQEKSISMTYKSLIPVSASNELVQEELQKLSTMKTKIYIIHTCYSLASRLFLNAKYLGMMDTGYKWIVTSKTMNFLNHMDDEVIVSMQGVVGFRSYIPQSMDLHKFTLKWREEYHAKKGINAYAIWAYDSVSALAMAVERIQVLTSNIKDLETTQKGTALLNQMLRISFQGLGGAFQFTNGRITAEVLEIINVIGKEEQRVGFWTKDAAFTRKIGILNSSSDILWPGGITTTTTHRMLQMSSKILRVGIPTRFRAGQLFEVNYDDQTNSAVISGFCADVFQVAFTALGRDEVLEYHPYLNETGNINYNDLITRVHDGDFDAAVGDITITANRSLYVDFTVPFTDLGLGILSRNVNASMWIFMKPLSSDLWFVFACFFILLGFVIWVLEHETNEEFQGSTAQQVGTALWFAFSTLVYSHREKLQSNLSRFVVIVWLCSVLVLVSSYTATLSSLLTVEQIRLASKSGSIGYQYGSLVHGLLVSNLNFKSTWLKPYSTPEEYAQALSHGSNKGGVDAIVDEIPYIKEFLTQYPSGYSMTISDASTNGFGFAFPLGSPLAREMSSQIARLRENGSLKMLEKKWFNQQTDTQPKDAAYSPETLNFERFRGLFLISGGSMAAALFLFMLYFIHYKVQISYKMLMGGKLAFIMRFLVPRTADAV